MFDSTSFVRPKPHTEIGAYVILIDRGDNFASTATSITNKDTVTDYQVNGYLMRVVSAPKTE